MDEHALAGLQLGAVEEAEPREVEREVERGRAGQRDRLGHLERRHGRADRVLGEAAVGALRHRDDAPPLPLLGAGAARVDDAHHLHAGAVRQLGPHHHVAAGDALEVVEVERDRLHLNPQLARLGLRNRHRVEPEHLGRPAVLVGAPRPHRAIIARMCNRIRGPVLATGPRSPRLKRARLLERRGTGSPEVRTQPTWC